MGVRATYDLSFDFNNGEELRTQLIKRIQAFLAQHPEIIKFKLDENVPHPGGEYIMPITVKFGVRVHFHD